jgi:hypothetical protein
MFTVVVAGSCPFRLSVVPADETVNMESSFTCQYYGNPAAVSTWTLSYNGTSTAFTGASMTLPSYVVGRFNLTCMTNSVTCNTSSATLSTRAIGKNPVGSLTSAHGSMTYAVTMSL